MWCIKSLKMFKHLIYVMSNNQFILIYFLKNFEEKFAT